jgi:dienelactone hydrolase
MYARTIATLCVFCALPAALHAEIKTAKVPYEHNGVKLEGFMAWDDSIQGKRPGVLVVHEWWGLDDYARGRAKQLAQLGYVAFALDMYGAGKLAKHPADAQKFAGEIRANIDNWLARANAGLAQLQASELVDKDRIAAIGYCFGGATVCQLAYHQAPLRGVVSFHGSLPVPTKEQAEKLKASILICHGAADGFIPAEQIEKFQATMDAAGADWMFIEYAGARHSFTVPAADKHGIEGIKYDAKADARSWKHMELFLKEVLAH